MDDRRVPAPADELPASLTLDEAFRAAFYMIQLYASLEPQPSERIDLLLQYLHSDPARWHDWLTAVRRGLADGGAASATI
ncbi:MAG: hypothetical protein ACR2M5_10495 [Nakamurella sp.]